MLPTEPRRSHREGPEITTPPTRPAPGGTYRLVDTDVARVGFGMGELARKAETSPEGLVEAREVLERALGLGIRHFDSGHFYGVGLANRLLAEVIGGCLDEVVLATKAGLLVEPGPPLKFPIAQRPHELRAAVEDNLRTLSTDSIQLLYIRRMDVGPGPIATGPQAVPLEDQIAELISLRDEGKVQGLGLSHVSVGQLTAALPAGLAAVQNVYHVLDRTSERLLELCGENNIAWVPFFPRGGNPGAPDVAAVVDDPTVRSVAARVGVTPSQVALAWQLAHAPNTILIAGTGTLRHLEENTSAADLVLDVETLLDLDAAAARRLLRRPDPCR